jgi:adenosine deaminase
MKCKAHAGEFDPADSVKEAVELLELDEVQHGIAAAGSPGVMKWLADHKIRLNVCPTSNIRLKRVRSFKTHPIRILFDHGVNISINTDDVVLFGDGVSEQYLKLFKAGVFTAEELDSIRHKSLIPP